MLYLNEEHIRLIGYNWHELADCIEQAAAIIDAGDYVQPLKPYLRYNKPHNRIIAMPAYTGGTVSAAGLKWIASFPDNIKAGLPRAHSVLILNEAGTGVPYAILNAPSPSIARTAAVSGALARRYMELNPAKRLTIGIIGWGPVGRFHYDMCCQLFGELIDQVNVFDIRLPKEADNMPSNEAPYPGSSVRTRFADSWQELYHSSNLIITCTVADQRYIDSPPRPGSLLLNVSLRDYWPAAIKHIDTIVVDDWTEVCRENTDIELLHLEHGLMKEHTVSLSDAICREALKGQKPDQSVLFCPMGMAVFDIAIADYFVRRARESGIGVQL